jgi:pimeloyl-ACP methyl ester carboxylesterase
MKKLFWIFLVIFFQFIGYSNLIKKIEYEGNNRISVYFEEILENSYLEIFDENNNIYSFSLKQKNYNFEIEENTHYNFYLVSDEQIIEKKSIFLFKNFYSNVKFEDKEKYILFFSESFFEKFESLIYIDHNKDELIEKVNISYFLKGNKEDINWKILFPFGFKYKNENTFDYINVNFKTKRKFPLYPQETTRYFPVINSEITKQEFNLIFPSVISFYDPITFYKDILEILEIEINFAETKKISKYSELWKVEIKRSSGTIERFIPGILKTLKFPYVSFRSPDQLLNEEKNFNKNKNAIIFIHGLQFHYPEELENSELMWKKDRLQIYWNDYFKYIYNHKEKFEIYDFFEYIYDTQSKSFIEFAEDLSEIMKKNNFEEYESIYFISHSMGALIARQSANNLNYSNIEKIISINGANKGSFLQNTIELFSFDLINESFYLIESDYDILKIFSDFIKENIFKTTDRYHKDILEKFFYQYPQFLPAIFCEMGILSPFIGGYSIRYDEKEILFELEKNFHSDGKIFSYNEEIFNLNKKDKYLDKTIFLSSYIEEEFELIYYFPNQIMNLIFKEKNFYEMKNDGALNLLSQFIDGENGNIEIFEGYNHESFLYDKEKIEYIFSKYILEDYDF